MNKDLDAFDSIGDVNNATDYENQLNDKAADSAEAPIKTLYLMTPTTLEIVERYADQDSRGFADVVRAAVHLLKTTTAEERRLAYESTRVVKKKRGRKPSL